MIRPAMRRGFTLLEIVIAIGIMAVGLVTIFSLFPVGIYAVKDTVDSSRSAGLARTLRSELAADRQDTAITAAGAKFAKFAAPGSAPGPAGYVPFGPWEFPADMSTFREPVYEFVDSGGTMRRRVVFDERTMMPMHLDGVFNGASVAIVPATLTRDSDLLAYYDLGTWDIYGNARGNNFRVASVTFNASHNLTSMTVDPAPVIPGPPGQIVRFVVFLPVTWREPPADVPQEWAAGMADFDSSPYAVDASRATRNLARHLVAGSWITADGDWYQVRSVNPVGGVPAGMTLDDAAALAAIPAPQRSAVAFNLVLPVVQFASGNFDDNGTPDPADDFLTLPIVAIGPQQSAYLDAGAWVEVVIDGARGTFDPANLTGRRSVTAVDPPFVNATTSGFIRARNFIRVAGRDYEIEAGLSGNAFDLVGTVPALGPDVYFNVVLGYPAGAGRLPQTARFPVIKVTRDAAGRIVSINVGRDYNGQLPTDFAGMDGRANPVHVLPRNYSQYVCQAVMSHRSPKGVFRAGSPTVGAPEVAAATAESPMLAAIPFCPAISDAVALLVPGDSPLTMMLLTEPTATGAGPVLYIDGVAAAPPALTLNADPGVTGNDIYRSFHAYDRNDFEADVPAGNGTYAGGVVTLSLPLLLPESVFLADGARVRLDGPADHVGEGSIASITADMSSFTPNMAVGSTLADGGAVTITVVKSAAGARSLPRGRGKFILGSNVVSPVYDSIAGVPTAFPFALAGGSRSHLSIGDYILGPDNLYYAVRAIRTRSVSDPHDRIILDRAYAGATTSDRTFTYITPVTEEFDAQIAVFRNYKIESLKNASFSKKDAAAFGFDLGGAYNARRVQLQVALPPTFKPGDYIRADGDAAHTAADPTLEPGLGDDIDGDRRWYMIEMVSADRKDITLTSPYRGYVPATEVEARQPASVTGALMRTFDTAIGSF